MNKIQKISLVGTLIAGTALCVALPLTSCSTTIEETVIPPVVEPPTGEPAIPVIPAKRVITAYKSNGESKVFEISKIKYGVSGSLLNKKTKEIIELSFISNEDNINITSVDGLINSNYYITNEVFSDLYRPSNRDDLGNIIIPDEIKIIDEVNGYNFNGSKCVFVLEAYDCISSHCEFQTELNGDDTYYNFHDIFRAEWYRNAELGIADFYIYIRDDLGNIINGKKITVQTGVSWDYGSWSCGAYFPVEPIYV